MPSEKGLQSPECGHTKGDNKRDSDHATGHGAFAPTLEHGHDSHHEEHDCHDTNCLHEHGRNLRSEIGTRGVERKGRGSQRVVIEGSQLERLLRIKYELRRVPSLRGLPRGCQFTQR